MRGASPNKEFDPWLAQLHDWECDPDPKKRVGAAKSIMRMLAVALERGADLPAPLRTWLSARLHKGARTGDANAAFGLKAGRGNHARYWVHMGDAAQVHAVMRWNSVRLQAAADEVSSLPGRRDASNLVKHHTSIGQRCTISGPYVAAEDDTPTDTLATRADLAAGVPVVVVFKLKLTGSYTYVLRVPHDIAELAAVNPVRTRRK